MIENKSNLFSIRFLNFITLLAYWLAIFGIVFTGVLWILSLLGFNTSTFVYQYSFPIHFNVIEAGVINKISESVSIVDAQGKIQFNSGGQVLINQLLVSMLVLFSIFFLVMGYLRKFMKNIRTGNFFIIENMILLRKVSYSLIGMWAVNVIVKIWFTFQITKEITFTTIDIRQNLNADFDMLILPAALLMLSHIFAEGIRLKTEQDLTV